MVQEPLQLRPMGVGELLDTVFRLYRRHFWLFVGIVAVIQVPMTLLQTVYQVTSFEPVYGVPNQSVALENNIVSLLVLIVTQGLLGAAMARAVSDRYLGRPLGLFDTYRALGWRWLRLAVALALLIVIDVVIVVLFFMIPCFLGGLVGSLLIIYLNLPILTFLAPVIVVEGKGVFAGLNRAFDLGRRKFWRLLGICILLFLLVVVIWVALFSLLTLIFNFWQPGFETAVIVLQLAGLVVTLIVSPVWLCTFTLFYFDLRIRLEGFDLELMMGQMDADEGQSSFLAQARRHLDQAYVYEEKNEFEDALRECEAAIQLVPSWAEAHNLRGILLEELGRLKKAVAAYAEAVRLVPSFSEAMQNLEEAAAELREKGDS